MDNDTIYHNILSNQTINNNISKMKEEYKKEPLTDYTEVYKDLQINYYRDKLYGTWSSVLIVPLHHFIFEIKTKKGTKMKEKYIPSKLIVQNFPEVTYFVRSGKDKPAQFGVASQGLSPFILKEQLTTLYSKFSQTFTSQQKIEMLENVEYVSFKDIKKKMHKIVDFIIKETTPKELNIEKVKCAKCGRTFRKIYAYQYNNSTVCSSCYKELKNNRFVDLDKIENGKFYIKYINSKRYFACHKCGLLCVNLTRHINTKHHMSIQDYEHEYNIDYNAQYQQRRKYLEERKCTLKFIDKNGKECNIYARGFKPEYYGRYDTKTKTTTKSYKIKVRQSHRYGEYKKYCENKNNKEEK